jgi:hypothetical protein
MSEESSTEQLLAELDELLDAPADVDRFPRPVALMETVSRQPNGLAILAEGYADAPSPVLIRSLTFLLARAAAPEQPDLAEVSPLVWTTMGRLRSDDPWSRVNILTAMQLLSMSGNLLPAGADAPRPHYPFLLDCLDRGAEVQDAMLPVVAYLHADGVLSRLPTEQVATLRARLLSLRDASDQGVRRQLAHLDAFFLDSGRRRFAMGDDKPTEDLLAELDDMEQ